MKPSLPFAALVLSTSLLFACSGGSTDSTGSNTDKKTTDKTPTDKSPTDKTPTEKAPTEKTCKSASLNGRCTAGPNKGSSCCYAPQSEDDPPCSQSNACETVCEYCE